MDASTTAGALGTGLGVFLIVLLVIGAVSGLVVGAIARFLLPGPDPMGWGKTMLNGIGGSFLGGLVARVLGISQNFGFVLSVACAAGLIWFFTRRNKPAGGPPANL